MMTNINSLNTFESVTKPGSRIFDGGTTKKYSDNLTKTQHSYLEETLISFYDKQDTLVPSWTTFYLFFSLPKCATEKTSW